MDDFALESLKSFVWTRVRESVLESLLVKLLLESIFQLFVVVFLVGCRIAILHEGRLKCCGSPQFLKRAYDCGVDLGVLRSSMFPWSPHENRIKKSRIFCQLIMQLPWLRNNMKYSYLITRLWYWCVLCDWLVGATLLFARLQCDLCKTPWLRHWCRTWGRAKFETWKPRHQDSETNWDISDL